MEATVALQDRCAAAPRAVQVMPVFIGFLRRSDPDQLSTVRCKAGCTQRPFAPDWLCSTSRQARSRGSELCGPSQFCNRRWPLGRPEADVGASLWPGLPQSPERISWPRPAEELGKGWRFLATYAELQTSPQLRHLIHRMRDSEC